MYTLLKRQLLRILKAPSDPPEAPAGSHDSVQIFRASPSYLRYRYVGLGLGVGFFILLFLFFSIGSIATGEWPLIVLAILTVPVGFVVMLTAYFLTRIDYDLRYYIVTDRSLRVRHGALIVREQTITYANVQNLRIAQGPLMRVFGVRTVEVHTAGGGAAGPHGTTGGHTVSMAGIDNAEEVRDLIRRRLRIHEGDAGLGDLERSTRGDGLSPQLVAGLQDVARRAGALRAAAEGTTS